MPFTYQGRLVDGPAPANGSYDLRFRVFGSLTGGAQLGSDILASPVVVTNGLFTVSLDFGDGIFTGASRWLEISARTNGAVGALSVLDPRQPITAVPYALFAMSGTGDAGALVTGTVPDARLSLNIARALDVAGASNVLAARLVATNDLVQERFRALTARMEQLVADVNTLSNQLASSSLRNQVLASRDPSDPAMTAMGLTRFARIDGGGWREGSSGNAPLPRTDFATAWTGGRFWVWGGRLNGQALDSGAQYDPVLDSWSPLPLANAPSARWGAAAAWAGDRVVVWGGFGTSYLGDGATFSPASMSWVATPSTGAPSARSGHAFAWTGSRFVVWGGRNAAGLLSDGALLDVGTGAWTPTPLSNAPEARRFATLTWAGDRLIVYGGEGASGEIAAGAVIPVAGGKTPGTWSTISTVNAPGPRVGHSAVWTGSRLLVWGGSRNNVPLADGAAYNPATGTWQHLASDGAPVARRGHHAVWTGQEMLVAGGEDASGPLASAATYNPVTDTWATVGTSGTPLQRAAAGGEWTGEEWLAFGGRTTSGGTLGSLQRLNPQAVWYLYKPGADAVGLGGSGGGGFVYQGSGRPQGVVGVKGPAVYFDNSNPSEPVMWIKATPRASSVDWVIVGQFSN